MSLAVVLPIRFSSGGANDEDQVFLGDKVVTGAIRTRRVWLRPGPKC